MRSLWILSMASLVFALFSCGGGGGEEDTGGEDTGDTGDTGELPEWEDVSPGGSETIHGLWGRSATDVFTVGTSGSIYRYFNYSWYEMVSGVALDLFSIWGIPPTEGEMAFAGGDDGTILRFNGNAWSMDEEGLLPVFYDIWGTGLDHVFAVGQNGICYFSTSTGWEKVFEQSNLIFRSVWGASSSFAIAVGKDEEAEDESASGVIYMYQEDQWQEADTGGVPDLNAVHGTSASNAYVAGKDGTILYWDGTTWTRMESGTMNTLWDIWVAPDTSEVFAFGNNGTILHLAEVGTSFEEMNTGTDVNLYAGWGSAHDRVYAAGMMGTVLFYSGPASSK